MSVPSDGILRKAPAHLPSGAEAASSRSAALASTLTALAGFTDAIGYSELGELYLSFMSGNSTHFGMALASAGWPHAALAGAIIATFVTGSLLGTLIADRARSLKPAVLGAELLILLAATSLTLLGAGSLGLIPISAAMGMQNTLHQVVAGADVGKGFLTGNLFALGQSLARAGHDKAERRRAAHHGLSWIAFAGGVVIGALVHARFGTTIALAVVSVVIATLLVASLSQRSR